MPITDPPVIASAFSVLWSIVNHLFVIDRSGSMMGPDPEPTRLSAATDATVHAMKALLRRQPDSKVAVVCFSDTAEVLCPWTAVTALGDLEEAQQRWLAACDELGHNNTGIGEALQTALVLAAPQPGGTQVVLLTDGLQNAGVDPLKIAPALRAVATVAVVGIGGAPTDVDQELLEQIASRDVCGRPRYKWIGHERGALVAHFEELTGYLARS